MINKRGFLLPDLCGWYHFSIIWLDRTNKIM